MRWLFNYIRQCFCKHDLEFVEQEYNVKWLYYDTTSEEIRVSVTCNKCGYHKWYKKFG